MFFYLTLYNTGLNLFRFVHVRNLFHKYFFLFVYVVLTDLILSYIQRCERNIVQTTIIGKVLYFLVVYCVFVLGCKYYQNAAFCI